MTTTRYETVAAQGGGTFDAYCAIPDSGGGPGLLLFQEIFGINDNMRGLAEKLAGEGYVVLVPDMFWRLEPRFERKDESGIGDCDDHLPEALLALSNPPKEFMSLADIPPKPGRQQKSSRAPRQAQTHLNEDERVELLERYLSGERAHVLGRAFNLDRRTVASILVRAGVRRARSMTEDERIEAARLYAEGWSCQQIGEQLGRDHGTVWLALRKAGVVLRQPWGRAAPPPSSGP